jgi:hypothetical protein
MIHRPVFATAATLAATLTLATAAPAADCEVDAESVWDMSAEEVTAFYDCMEAAMAESYAENDHPAASAYRDWTVTSTRPAVQGAHSERLLQTFANDTAADEYLKFAADGVDMPAGSVLAKESLGVDDGKGRVGPLFLMTKLQEGEAPDTDDWRYDAVTGSGGTMGISQAFCHDCHVNWEAQDNLAYPMEEVRVSN